MSSTFEPNSVVLTTPAPRSATDVVVVAPTPYTEIRYAQPTRPGIQFVEASSAPDSDNGLSTAAKAGIGAGVGAAVLIALLMLGYLLYRRRRITKTQSPVTTSPMATPVARPVHPPHYETVQAGGGNEGKRSGSSFSDYSESRAPINHLNSKDVEKNPKKF
ncbi:hypothetical protein B0J11DRAFT_580097 [Dendryphion nanum]|uniref:Uncharacterized protein n=1 Tax=Dendryphion nanum TaxID=256645 RepID=A0A9P9DUL2_9PLEO|nr:hypothetical protein B0J11DRAFT_580097 [Dendryphion nanum]